MSAPCNGPALAYTPFKRLENANRSGPPHRQSGIFLPVIRKGYNCLFPAIGESAGGSDRKALRRSTMRFLAPLVPRPLTLMAGSSPAVGDRAMSDPLFDPPPRLTYRPDSPFDADRDEMIAAVRSILSDMSLLAEWLETEPHPILPYAVIHYIAAARLQAHYFTPSLTRH